MTLYEYVSAYQVNKARMAREIGVSESGLYKYINQEREPILSIALKIYKFTNKKVKLEDMVIEREDHSTKKKTADDSDLL